MSNSELKLLPIGTVIKLKDVKKWVMIYGRNQIQTKTKSIYDYLAVPYPEGNLSEEFNIFFNSQMIEEVIYLGLESPQENTMKEKVEKDIKNLRRKEDDNLE
ncbi:DUF4176 domain-containing protein [Peribacillus frigoritolerans]|uniref:DUF4176 domain-containing protein n=1 Tax=Peribacillus frigoritolerans TaxID=450367 RepID=UPI003513A1AA